MLEELLKPAVRAKHKERRRSVRVDMRVPVIVHSKENSVVTSLYFSKNVSKDGILVVGPEKSFVEGERVYLEFSVPLQIVSRRIRLIGRVVRVEDEKRVSYAVKFEKVFNNDYKFLGCYLPSLKVAN